MPNVQQPTRTIAHNLRWTRSGVVWADFVLTGVDYGYRSADDKKVTRALHRALARSLPGESLLLGVCAGLNPLAIVERMERGIDLDLHPDWDAECGATLDTLRQFGPGQRIYYLSVPLNSGKIREQIKTGFTSAINTVGEMMGVPASAVSADEVKLREEQSDRIADAIPAPFRPVPATPAQMVWLWEHQLRRGLKLDPDMPDHATTAGGTKRQSAFSHARVDEGALIDRHDEEPTGLWAKVASKLPTYTPVLRIDRPWDLSNDDPTSYQVAMCVADTPAGGTTFPGSEFLSICDHFAGEDIDWAMRLKVASSSDVLRRNRRALINLNEQFDQRSGEVSNALGHLGEVAQLLSEYDSKFSADRMEVEVGWAAIITVGADTKKRAQQLARSVTSAFEGANYRLSAPIGFQEELFWACVPGAPTPKICNEFQQIAPSHDWAAFVPCVRNDLGDKAGPLIALNISTTRIGVVHHDTGAKAQSDVSPSLAVTGNLGSGKSVLLKTAAANIIDRGGQAIVIDSTPLGEYEKWARALTKATVVNIGEPDCSLDPLRVFKDQRHASESAGELLMPLMDIKPTTMLGTTLSEILSVDYRTKHKLKSLGAVHRHLSEDKCELEGAKEIKQMFRTFARSSYTAVLFDDSLPALAPTSPAIVMRTHTLQLPTKEDITQAHLYDNMTVPMRVGHVMYQYITELAKEICFANPDQDAVFLCDEAHRITAWQRGQLILAQFVKDGRKHGAAVFLGSQDPSEDFGTETMQGLIPTRIVMRQTEERLARKCLIWLGVGDDDELVKQLMEETSPSSGEDDKVPPHRRGEGYMIDARNRVARIKVLAPSLPARFKAVTTTPKQKRIDDDSTPRAEKLEKV